MEQFSDELVNYEHIFFSFVCRVLERSFLPEF
jgi:hypothetical protein